MNDGLNITVELVTNIVESLIYTDFIYRFFGPKYKGLKNILGFLCCLALKFTLVTCANFYSFESSFYLDIPDAIILTTYAVIFLHGRILSGFVVSIIMLFVNTGICSFTGFLVEFITGVTVAETMTKGSLYRVICIIITKLLLFFFTRLILKFKKEKIHNLNIRDCALLIITPLLLTYSLLMLMLVFIKIDLSTDMLVHMILFSAFNMAAVLFMYYMVRRIEKSNKLKTEYSMLTQQYEMQNKSMEKTNEVMCQLSAFRHDVKNNMKCVSELIKAGNYDAAVAYCNKYCDNIEKSGTVYYTSNDTLNAIINVKVNYAKHKDIDVKTIITDDMSYMDNIDTCVLLANIMDNAIEAEEKLSKKNRYMELEIYERKNYHCIQLKNRINGSVLKYNKDLLSTKLGDIEHGIGHKNVERIVKKYSGDVRYYEENNIFCCGIIIPKIPIIP